MSLFLNLYELSSLMYAGSAKKRCKASGLWELFQTVDRSHRGKIGLASLQEILNTALARDFKAEPHNWHKFIDNLQLANSYNYDVIKE
ncbi:hypothetical protein MAR_017792 [Mya arenaria]|uniref:EF-hand domain-containing protein n=1 Tax=Mya arenaria TaxID=6604 RepID=A0ABY7EHG6_MYAAR|nr:hypothetical protein MAR_017792 [Mya arenaria]